jgi:hypothetical protein
MKEKVKENKKISMKFNSIEAIIIAMQSSQFSMEEKEKILINFFEGERRLKLESALMECFKAYDILIDRHTQLSNLGLRCFQSGGFFTSPK